MAGDKLHRWLSQGGQRAIRTGATAEVFTRNGPKLERESPGGERTQVSHLLDPRLKLTGIQRAIGNCYGHLVQSSASAGGAEFLREFVDKSPTSGGGGTAHKVHIMRMVEVARKAAQGLPVIVYPVGRSRGYGFVGPHKPVSHLKLIEGICVRGVSLQTIAVEHGWLVERMGGKAQGKREVPDRQRKRLAAELCVVLDTVSDAWDSKGYSIPYEFTRLVVK